MSHAKQRVGGFSGPLFIVGFPRSGTKLLRGLLVRHPSIGIAPIETKFLPYWITHWHRFGDLSDFKNFERFYQRVQHLSYFTRMAARDLLISPHAWFERCHDYSAAGVFEALVRHDAHVEPGSGGIWGDKSPSYLRHLSTLKRTFPAARFVHIVRDARDCCLSAHKAWNSSILRAAQRWVDEIKQARSEAEAFRDDYTEVLFERLLDQPSATLASVCDVLGVDFLPTMLELDEVYETVGDAQMTRSIVTSNHGKYLTGMDPQLRHRIDAIAADVLLSLGYPSSMERTSTRLGPLRMLGLKLVDGWQFYRHGGGTQRFSVATARKVLQDYRWSR